MRNRLAAPNISIDKHDFHLCFLEKTITFSQNRFSIFPKKIQTILFLVTKFYFLKKKTQNKYLSQFIISFHLFSLIKNKRLVVPVAILEVIKNEIGGKLDNVTFTTVYQLNILINQQYRGA